jgi:hypothetical protein
MLIECANMHGTKLVRKFRASPPYQFLSGIGLAMIEANSTSRATPMSLTMRRERIIVGRLWLRLILESGLFPDIDRPVRPLDACLIVVVGLADLEDRPLTAHKVAKVVAHPRATVIRRLSGLVREGILIQDELRQFHLRTALFEERLSYIKRFVRWVISAGDALKQP